METVIVKLVVDSSDPPAITAIPDDVIRAAREIGVELHPLHPGAVDASLATYFFATVENRETAEQLVSQIRDSDSVDGIYVKPAGEPPA
jgi:hypothetical protein